MLFASDAAGSGPLLVEPGGAGNSGTTGTAFDLAVRFRLDSQHVPAIAVGARALSEEERFSLFVVLGEAARASRAGDDAALARACAALALGDEVFRMGTVAPGGPLARLRAEHRSTPDSLMDAGSPSQVRDLVDLLAAATDNLLPHLAPPFVLGPRFDASRACRADADLVAGTSLVELKTALGAKNQRTGVRQDRLDGDTCCNSSATRSSTSPTGSP